MLTLTLKDASTLRLFPNSVIPVDSNKVSGDLYQAENAGIITIEDEVVLLVQDKVVVKEEVKEVKAVPEKETPKEEQKISMKKPK